MTRLAYTPRNDAIFKMIFGDGRDIDILTDFLKATLDLPAEDYAEVTLVDPHLARKSPEDKLGILDKDHIDQPAQTPQRVTPWNTLFQADVTEH